MLPLSNLSGDPAQDYFSDGITEDIITELSRFRSLFVVARHSSFAYRANSADIRAGRPPARRSILAEGSARKIGRRVRVTVKLLDAASGFTLWTERYDREIEDIFAIQDEIVGKIVSALPGRLEDAGRKIARGKQTSSITAYDLVLMGNERWRQLTVRSMEEARGYFRKAVGLDPAYARAHANIAWTVVCARFWNHPPSLHWMMHFARSRSPSTLTRMTHGRTASSHSFSSCKAGPRGRNSFQMRLALNPNDADVAAVFANILVYWGRRQDALTWIKSAKRLNPFPPNLYHWYHALALYSGKEYEQAAKALMEMRALDRWAHALLAACYAQMDRLSEARSEAEAFVRERNRELNENDEALPANTLDLVRARADRYRESRRPRTLPRRIAQSRSKGRAVKLGSKGPITLIC